MNEHEVRNAKYAEDQVSKASLAAKQRVETEAQELKEKSDRLEAFINGPQHDHVSDTQKGLLRAQLVHMRSYWQILKQRLEAWD